MNSLWLSRSPSFGQTIKSKGYKYDPDFNLVMMDKSADGETFVYRLSEADIGTIPESDLEKLAYQLSSTPHQSLISLHQNLQGIYLVLQLFLLTDIFRFDISFLSVHDGLRSIF